MGAEIKPSPNDTVAEQRAVYESWHDEQVRLGVHDIESGRIVSHEEVEQRTAELPGKLESRHGREAA